MKHKLRAGRGGTAGVDVPDVAFNEPKPRRSVRPWAQDGLDIVAVSGGKIVQANHCLAQIQQRFEQIRSNESSDPGYQPRSWFTSELAPEAFVSRITVDGPDRSWHEAYGDLGRRKPSTVTDSSADGNVSDGASGSLVALVYRRRSAETLDLSLRSKRSVAAVVRARTSANINRSAPLHYSIDTDESKL